MPIIFVRWCNSVEMTTSEELSKMYQETKLKCKYLTPEQKLQHEQHLLMIDKKDTAKAVWKGVALAGLWTAYTVFVSFITCWIASATGLLH